MNNQADMLEKVQYYRDLVKRYEGLCADINALLEAHEGNTETMSADAIAQYRQLAQTRDDLHNEMRVMEQQLLNDDD